MKHFDKTGVKKILFEPVAAYYSDALNTLTSLVQALALAIFGYELQQCFFPEKEAPLDPWSFQSVEFVIIFLVICVLWQRYTSHNQLYAWTLGLWDTLIPIGFGFIETILILTIKKGYLNYFTFWFWILSCWGLVAYINTHFKFKTVVAWLTYQEHFSEYGEKFARDLFQEVKRFEDKSLAELVSAVIITGFWNLVVFKDVWISFQKPVFAIICGAILFHLFYDSVWKHLLKSDKLNNYVFWAEIQKRQILHRKNNRRRLLHRLMRIVKKFNTYFDALKRLPGRTES